MFCTFKNTPVNHHVVYGLCTTQYFITYLCGSFFHNLYIIIFFSNSLILSFSIFYMCRCFFHDITLFSYINLNIMCTEILYIDTVYIPAHRIFCNFIKVGFFLWKLNRYSINLFAVFLILSIFLNCLDKRLCLHTV